MTTSESLARIREAVEEAGMQHTVCEMYPEHFALDGKACPVPGMAAALGVAVEALQKYDSIPNRDGEWGAERALVEMAERLGPKP